MSEFVLFFFDLTNNIKLYHWTTTSFSRHKGSDELFDSIVDLSDKFMEVYMGKYGRPKIALREQHKLSLKQLTDNTAVEYIKSAIKVLKDELSKHLKDTDVDLLNIRDEILAKLNQTLYLFTLQ
jgi:hypothetical protein